MTLIWSAVDDDNLLMVEKTVSFLQTEYCPKNVPPMWSESYFSWKLGAMNPAGRGNMSVALLGDKVVGCVSLTKRRVIVNGIEYIAGEVGDSYTSASMRRRVKCSSISKQDDNPDSFLNKSVFGRLASDVRARAERGGVSLIYGTPNENAFPGWTKRLGYKSLTPYDNRVFARPTVKYIITKKSIFKPFREMLYAIETFSIYALSLTINIKQYDDVLVKKDEWPEDFQLNRIWDSNKSDVTFSLVRDAQYWDYRYRKHPLAKYSLLSFNERDEVLGFIVTRVMLTAKGARILYIAEWMYLKNRLSLDWILMQLVKIYRNTEIDGIYFYGDGTVWEESKILRLLFIKRNKIPVIISNSTVGDILFPISNSIVFHMGNTDAV